MNIPNNQPINGIGVAIAGLGFGEKVHLPALETNSNFKVLALWHPREDRLKEACELYKLKGYQNWDNLLQDKSIQVSPRPTTINVIDRNQSITRSSNNRQFNNHC